MRAHAIGAPASLSIRAGPDSAGSSFMMTSVVRALVIAGVAWRAELADGWQSDCPITSS